MSILENRPPPEAGDVLVLAFDVDADDVVGEHRAERTSALTGRDRLAAVVLGGAFAVAAAALAHVGGGHRDGRLSTAIVYLVVYAVVSSVEFEVFDGAATPAELVLVPMLFVLPLGTVPLVVAGGLLVGALAGPVARGASVERAALTPLSAWHAVGPVAVFALAGAGTPTIGRWPVYLGALAAQFLVETIVLVGYEGLARGVPPRRLLPHLWRVQAVDAMLAPVGLAVAAAARGERSAVLLVLPLAVLLRVFAHERRARIDNALELSAAYRGTAFLLGDVVEADDAYTGLHSRDVVDLSVAVADELGVAADERRETELVALLHDVGKIRMPSGIVNKPGPLTAEERALMETHTIEGEKMLDQVGGLLGRVGHLVRSCHERWDGCGYPDGLAGEEIPRVARIVMCCDAFSAMTTDRSYRRALPLGDAVAELRANAGTQFDPEVVRALVTVVERGAVRQVSGAAARSPAGPLGSASSL